ncbi:MAG: SPASM domain-containing protein [Bacteroidetes bacterium]|nr:SPASM domain-containing protein [Bacteroidota bacterium]
MEKYSRVDEAGFTRLIGKEKNPIEILTEEIGEKFKEYRELWEGASSFNIETDFPVEIDFEIASKCNLKCNICYHGWRKVKRNPFLDIKLYKKIIDESDGRLKSVLLNVLGEPLLNKQIIEFIEYAYDKGVVDIYFNSNAILLNENIIQELLNSHLTRIHFSIDAATKKTYEMVRGEDKFDQVVANIENFYNQREKMGKRLPIIRTSFVKCKFNLDEIELFFNKFAPMSDYFSIQEFLNPLFDTNEILSYRPDGDKRLFSDNCSQPWGRLVVLSDGTVGPCCVYGFNQNLKVGDANKESIFEIWNSEPMKKLRMIHKEHCYFKNVICKECLTQ